MKNVHFSITPAAGLLILVLAMTGCKKEPDDDQITDADGNIYSSITLGTQVWMTGNLKTTKYNDGTDIPLVTDNTTWSNLSTPGYCWYNNESSNKNVYGALYNWQAVETGKLCPDGWHVPTDEEWDVLVEYAGGNSISGGRLKETGFDHWNDPNLDATDSYGFKAVGAGFRDITGPYQKIHIDTYWWSSTEYSDDVAMSRYIHYYNAIVFRIFSDKKYGSSVRCLKD